MQSTLRHTQTKTALYWLALIACLAWLFYPGLIASEVPTFRDAYHFYYPQAVWLERCAQQGDYFPTWNPSEGLGVSIAGQPSAALYYPLRPVWWLPGLDTAQKFSIFIVAHLLIAAIGMRLATRRLGLSDQAAWLAAISYSLSCPVFFQHTNLIYLCSAAWIGFALGAVFTAMQATGRRELLSSCIAFAAAASLMLLGGDPQTAVNAFIMVGVLFVAVHAQCRWSARKLHLSAPQTPKESSRDFDVTGTHLGWLVATAVLFTILSFVQWLPAWRWASHSGRTQRNSTEQTLRTVATATAQSQGSSQMPAVDAVLRESSPPRHHRYDFSLSPWHLLTCVWPTAGGHYLPSNSRVFAAIPAEGRMWIPSLYFGCWPCLLVLLAGYQRSTRTRLLIVVAGFALLASFGNYAILWLLREILGGVGLTSLAQHLPADHVGSLAWLLNTCLPGYSMFRYPAKWTVWFVAAASLIAALQFDRLSAENLRQSTRRFRRTFEVLSLVGLVMAGSLWIAAIAGYSLDAWLSQVAPDRWLGPPNTRSVAHSLVIACLITRLSFLVGSMESEQWKRFLPNVARRSAVGSSTPKKFLPNVARRSAVGSSTLKKFLPNVARRSAVGSSTRKKFLPSIALLTLVEMTLSANKWTSFLPAPTAPLDSLSQFYNSAPAHAPRFTSGIPFVWANHSQADLLGDRFIRSRQSFEIDQARYQQAWRLGKLGLLSDARSLNATQSIEPFELAQLRTWLSRHDRLLGDQPDVDQVLRELGVTHRLLRTRFDSQPSQFTWQPVDAPRPLCQLSTIGLEQVIKQPEIDWHWPSPDQLDVHIAAPQAAMLLIRQTNDGGWLARNQRDKLLDIDEKSMFIEIPLTNEDSQVKLSRKWFR
ncbi:MAG: hypothetical protein IT422_01195 [Pirellulaceae bacterium]|nr:hypothetical protein [Pirellulaceae bacterium]